MNSAVDPDLPTVDDRDRLSLALEAAGVVGIWDGDLVNDRIYADESFARIYGVDARDAISGKPLGFYFQYIHPDDLQSSTAEIERMRAGVDEYANEHRIVRPDGSLRWVLARGRLVRDASGRPVRFHGVSIDLTERKLAENRQAFMLELSDELRNSGDPERVLATATARLGAYLGAARVGYGEVQPDRATVLVTCGYANGADPVNGTFRLDEFGPGLAARAQLGLSLVEDDVLTQPDLQSQTWSSFGTRAHVSVPLIRDGQYRALLYVTHTRPHHWSGEEVRLIEEVAERIWDALERARAERALHCANEELISLVAARTADRNRIWQLAEEVMITCDTTGRLIEVNPAASRLLGLSEREVRGLPLSDFLHPEDVKRTAAEILRLVAEGSSAAFENRYRTRAGTYRRISWMAISDGGLLHGVGRDVTAEYAARRELQAASAERERLWSATNDLMGTASFDGYLVSVNPAWTRMLGFSESELTSRPYMEFIDPEDHERAIAIVRRMHGGEAMHNFESRMLHKDGHRFVILWTGQRHGDLMYLVGRDITAQRAVEEKLRQSQKMEAVGQLTGGIAHDFNNMLQGIRGAVEVMSRRIAQGRLEEAQQYISIARQSIDRAATLTHRLLAFSRRQALAPQAVEVGGLLHGVGKLIEQTLGPMIDFRVHLLDGCWPVRCDPNQLENAVLNLAINARDAMLPQGGSLVIETAHTVLGVADVADWEGAMPGDFVCLCVRDTGNGMSPQVVQRAFEPFFTTKPDGQGTGLGLSQVYGFVSQSGGFMKLDSEVGVGTAVRIYLPRYVGEPPANPTHADSSFASSDAVHAATVLLVEDEADIRNITAQMLREHRHIVIEASDGCSALAALQERLTRGASIDILVADIGLPGGTNGRQLANAVRQLLPDLPVLLITGYAGQALGPGSEVSEGISLLSKPFSFETLAARVEALVAPAS
jgi:PAS domain S-box-containing protein